MYFTEILRRKTLPTMGLESSTLRPTSSLLQLHLKNKLKPPPGPARLDPFKQPVIWGPCSGCHSYCFGRRQAYPEPVHPERLGVHGFTYNPTLTGLPAFLYDEL